MISMLFLNPIAMLCRKSVQARFSVSWFSLEVYFHGVEAESSKSMLTFPEASSEQLLFIHLQDALRFCWLFSFAKFP